MTRPRLPRGRVTVAVGLAAGAWMVLAVSGPPVAAEPGFVRARLVPEPPGSPAGPAEPYASLSCPAVGACTVAGPAVPAFLTVGASVDSERAGVWGNPVALALPPDADEIKSERGSALTAVACWSVGDCAAVGSYNVAVTLAGEPNYVARPMVAVESDGTWGAATAAPVPAATGTVAGQLSAVSCDPTGDCTALGYFVTVSPTLTTAVAPFSESESGGGAWSLPTDLPRPSGSATDVADQSLSCWGANDCTATEQLYLSGLDHTFFLNERGGVWQAPIPVGKVGVRPVALSAISCTVAASCVAVGSSSARWVDVGDIWRSQPAVDREVGGVWESPRDLRLPMLAPLLTAGAFDAISCASATCEAVGLGAGSTDGSYATALAATLSGPAWSTVGLDATGAPLGTAPVNATALVDVSCVDSDTCAALGRVSGDQPGGGSVAAAYVVAVIPAVAVTRPGSPRSVTVASGASGATVSFRPPTTDGGARIRSFTVTAASDGEPERHCTTPGLACGLSGLVRTHTYSVSVVATSAAGTSVPSARRTFVAR